MSGKERGEFRMACSKGFSRSRPVLSAALSWLLTLQCMQVPAGAQQESTLEIVILAGENLTNVADTGSTLDVAIRVQDRNGRRIPGAAVTFQAPSGYGTFLGGDATISLVTDANGEAHVRFRRGQVGPYFITVSASFEGARGTARIQQINGARATGTVPTRVLVLGGIAAAIAGAIYGATRGGGDRTTSVTAGPGTVTAR